MVYGLLVRPSKNTGKELITAVEGCIMQRLRLDLSIPPIGGHTIEVSTEPISVV